MTQAGPNSIAGPVTDRQPFGAVNSDGVKLFSVNPGVPVADALEQASVLLATVRELTHDLGMMSDSEMGGGSAFREQAWAVNFLSEMAKAIIDASTFPTRHARVPVTGG